MNVPWIADIGGVHDAILSYTLMYSMLKGHTQLLSRYRRANRPQKAHKSAHGYGIHNLLHISSYFRSFFFFIWYAILLFLKLKKDKKLIFSRRE
jgi:hypothetical protein